MMASMLSTPTMVYHPELLSRRGEYVAGGLALLTFTAWFALHLMGVPANAGLRFLVLLLVSSAIAISLGNWIDRRTLLRIEPDGIGFDNGLRRVFLPWNEIHQVQVFPSTWGKKVNVIGDRGHFNFRTLGEVTLQGKIKGRLGFEKGDEILAHILDNTRLKRSTGPENIDYYARE
jgi:hypothetical protein